MAFVNGFPDEDSIKLPLYSVEPEQLSDLVAVPFTKDKLWDVLPITGDTLPNHQSDRDIQAISFPLSNYPCLFQRYNPVGLKFADEYSTKLYKWRIKYSRSILLDHVSYLKPTIEERSFTQQTVNFDIGKALKIKLPDTNDRIRLSYYYPELNPEGFTLLQSDGNYRIVEPKEVKDWRTLNVTPNTKPLRRNVAYEYRRIDNECIACSKTRSFLLRFETYFCKGQEIEIDEDCLIASLIIDYEELPSSDIAFIKNQIPECYFYEYLDTFFEKIDEAIRASFGSEFNIKQPTRITQKFSMTYDIFHRQNSTEKIRNTGKVYYNGQLDRDDDVLEYGLNIHNLFELGGTCDYVPKITYSEYVNVSDKFIFGGIVYANNNYWDNYDYQLQDLGIVEVSILQYTNLTVSKKQILFEYLGEYYKSSSGFTISNPPFGLIDGKRNYGLVNNFEKKKIIHSGSLQTDFLHMERQLARDGVYIWNNYFNRLLYDSIFNIADFDCVLTNTIEATDRTVPNELYPNLESNPYFAIGTRVKVFQIAIRKYLTSCNYVDSEPNRVSPSKTISYEDEKIIIGRLDCSFNKYGKPHPTARRYQRTGSSGQYVPVKYFRGVPTSNERSTPVSATYGASLSAESIILNSTEPNYPDTLYTYVALNKYSLPQDTVFSANGEQEFEYISSLTKATALKILPRIPGYNQLLVQIKTAHEDCYMANIDIEEMKKRVYEIHLALDAEKFAYQDDSEEISRVANLGYYIERLARILGISVNSDGSIRSIRQSKLVDTGQTIPQGWNLGQWGRNNGGNSQGQEKGNPKEERDGLAMEIRSNQFKNDDFTGETNRIEQGGYALVENLPQMLHILMTDLDRALGLQDAGANVLPSPNGDKVASYQGMNQMMLDILYTLGQISKQTSSVNILAMKNQAMIQELMAGYGLPVQINEMEINTALGGVGKIPFPAFAPHAPTLNDLHALTNLNLAAVIGSKLQVKAEEEEEDTDDTENTDINDEHTKKP